MRENSRSSLIRDAGINIESIASLPSDVPIIITNNKSNLPLLPLHQQQHSDNALISSKYPIQTKLFELQACHVSPHELLQERLIERAVEKHASHLRAGTDLEKLKKLSKITLENRRAQLSISPARRNYDMKVIFSPKASEPLTPKRQSELGQVAQYTTSLGFGLQPAGSNENLKSSSNAKEDTSPNQPIKSRESLLDQRPNSDVEVSKKLVPLSPKLPQTGYVKHSPPLKKGDGLKYRQREAAKKPSKLH